MLDLGPGAYRAKYGKRRLDLTFRGEQLTQEELYAGRGRRDVVSYETFRQRLAGLRRRDRLLVDDVIEDALALESSVWIQKYGGGRRKSFVYGGAACPEHRGKHFLSLKDFLRAIGRAKDYATIKQRSRGGESLDCALTRPIRPFDERRGQVYLLRCRSTDQRYVGLTLLDLDERWRFHCREAEQGSPYRLHCAIREHGADAFERSLLECDLDQDRLAKREIFWIKKLGTLAPAGLNANAGGALGGGRRQPLEVEDERFASLTIACETLGKRYNLPEHVVARRIRNGHSFKLPARRHSSHPMAGTQIWRRWQSLHNGIATGKRKGPIDADWADFDRWYQDIGRFQEPGKHMVRLDEDRPWESGNVAWVTIQGKIERVHGKALVVEGRAYPSMKALADAYGLGRTTLKHRIEHQGMAPDKAVAADLGTTSPKAFAFEGKTYRSLTAAARSAARKYNITFDMARDRLRRGVPLDRKNHAKACRVGHLEFASEAAAARHFGVIKGTFAKRRHLGWSIEQALGLEAPPKVKP